VNVDKDSNVTDKDKDNDLTFKDKGRHMKLFLKSKDQDED